MPKLFDFQASSMPSWWDGNYRMPWTQTNLDLIAGDGASEVVIVPTVYMDTLNSTVVYRDNSDPGGLNVDGAPRTESDGSIRVAIEEAKARGLEVIFKLHVNIQNEDWNALIGPPEGSTPEQAKAWADAWFASYKEAVVHYARLAQEQGIKAFAIGNECESMTGPQYREYWVDIIEAVREVYSGQLTYAATWTEALTVSFWDALDYIGANPYISFTNSDNPTLQQLIDGWTKPSQFWHVSQPIIDKYGENISAIDALRRVAQEHGKKLIFTETGFRSLDGSNSEPWVWGNGRIDELEQLNMYKAFYQIITDRADEGWVGGYWLWNYDAGQEVSNPSPDDGYSTHGKRVDAVVEQYFKDPVAVTGRVISGTGASDVLVGGFNNDTLVGGAGNDTLQGNNGADVFVYAGGDGADTILDFQPGLGDVIRLTNTGATGFGDLQISAVSGGYAIAFAGGGSLTIMTSATPAASWFVFNDGGQSGPSTKPSAGNDEITGTAKADAIDALAGDDVINGLGGNDRLFGGDGLDTIDGGAGNDQLHGGAGGDVLDGGAGNDRLFGGNDADILSGGDGNDQIRGDGDDDMLYGEAGNDILLGGDGYDLLDGGAGNDRLYGHAGDDQIMGGEGNDILQGGAGADRIEGDDGDDRLYGGDGDDIVEGWFGDDLIWGGAGGDVLVAGGGIDRLWGGAGADRFVFGDGMEQDVIYDFKLKQGDMLIIQGNMNGTGIGSDDFSVLQQRMTQVGNDTVIDLGNGDTLTLVNFLASTLRRDDVWFW